jgi:dethiobiotin synthetase
MQINDKFKHKRQFVISSIGTDVGKTFTLEQICQDLNQKKKKYSVIKPVISGFDQENPENTDTGKILKAMEKKVTPENIEKISPWRFKQAVSPDIAAKGENRQVDFFDIVTFCQKKVIDAQIANEYLFIEGAGGVMSPICKGRNFLDLMWHLHLPTILVVKGYLGCISHTLTAIEALKSRKIPIAEIRFNFYQKSDFEILESLKNFTRTNIVTEFIKK